MISTHYGATIYPNHECIHLFNHIHCDECKPPCKASTSQSASPTPCMACSKQGGGGQSPPDFQTEWQFPQPPWFLCQCSIISVYQLGILKFINNTAKCGGGLYNAKLCILISGMYYDYLFSYFLAIEPTHSFFFKIAMPAREEPYMWQMTPTGACLSPSECFIQSPALLNYGAVSDVQ